MNQLPYDDPTTLKQVFTHAMSAVSTDRQMAEQIINQMMNKDPQRYVFTLIDQIILPEDPSDEPMIRLVALILAKNCLRNKKKTKFTPETFNTIREKILTLMLNNNYPRTENQIKEILEILYQRVSNAQDIQADLISIKNKTNTTDPKVQKTLFLTLESLFYTPRSIKKQLAPQFEELAIWLIDTGHQQTQGILTEVRNSQLEIATPNHRRNIPFVDKQVKTLESWLETILQVVSTEFPLDKLTPELVDQLQSKPSYQKLFAVLQDILTLNISFENQPDSNDLISIPIDTPAHYEINSVKAKALELLTHVLKALELVSSQVDVTKFDFFQTVQNRLLQFVLTSFDSFLNGQRYRDLCENEEVGEVEGILLESGVFLRGTAAFKQLYTGLDISIPDLLIRCILPMLRATPGELNNYRHSATDFANNLYDICFEQKLVDKRSAMAGFLNAMISHKEIGDALKLLLNLAEFSIAPDLANYPELAQYEESNFITEIQPEVRLETCLLTIACLHKNLDENMKKTIAEFLKKHYSSLIDSPSMEIKIKLCFFIACYSDYILNSSSENQDLGADCFRFILESVNVKDEESVCLIETAARTLGILFKNNSLSGFLNPYTMDTLRVLTEIFFEDGKESIMDLLLVILENYEPQVLEEPEFLLDLIKTLATKIEEGFQKENCVGDEKVKLKNMRDLLNKIFEKKQYILKVQNDLEQAIQPLLTLLQETHINNKMDTFKHRDVLSLLIPLLPAVKNLTQTLLSNISQTFPLVIEIDHNLAYLFFNLSDIIKDPSAVTQFNQRSELLQLLLEIIIKAVHQKTSFDRSELICQGALLFQLIFQYVEPLTESHVENILQTTCQLLKTTVSPLIRVQLICVILNALHLKFATSQTILSKLDTLNYFLNCLLENLFNIDDFSYCRQVLIIGLSSILNHSNISKEIQSRLPELFNVLVSFLQTQQLIIKKTKREKFDYKSDKILLKKFLDDQDIMEEEATIAEDQEYIDKDDDDEDQEDEESQNTENRPINKYELQEMIDDDFKTEFKNKNALEFFKNEMDSLKQNNEELFRKLTQHISEKKKKFLENL